MPSAGRMKRRQKASKALTNRLRSIKEDSTGENCDTRANFWLGGIQQYVVPAYDVPIPSVDVARVILLPRFVSSVDDLAMRGGVEMVGGTILRICLSPESGSWLREASKIGVALVKLAECCHVPVTSEPDVVASLLGFSDRSWVFHGGVPPPTL